MNNTEFAKMFGVVLVAIVVYFYVVSPLLAKVLPAPANA